MRIWPIVGGALLGARTLRVPGLVLGAGVAWGMMTLLDLRNRVERLEAHSRRRFPHRREHPPAPRAEPAGRESEARYPEEAIVDALLESDVADLPGLYDEVSGHPPER